MDVRLYKLKRPPAIGVNYTPDPDDLEPLGSRAEVQALLQAHWPHLDLSKPNCWQLDVDNDAERIAADFIPGDQEPLTSLLYSAYGEALLEYVVGLCRYTGWYGYDLRENEWIDMADPFGQADKRIWRSNSNG